MKKGILIVGVLLLFIIVSGFFFYFQKESIKDMTDINYSEVESLKVKRDNDMKHISLHSDELIEHLKSLRLVKTFKRSFSYKNTNQVPKYSYTVKLNDGYNYVSLSIINRNHVILNMNVYRVANENIDLELIADIYEVNINEDSE